MDGKQQELVKDNFELKDLCLYLDEERNNQIDNSETQKGISSPSIDSCAGDKLSCPQCGYGPIWIVSGPGPKSDLNVALSIENAGTTTEKERSVSGKIISPRFRTHRKSQQIQLGCYGNFEKYDFYIFIFRAFTVANVIIVFVR